MLNRAYSLLEVKSVDEARRLIRGVATTPKPDRMGDVVEPMGAEFPPTIPLLLHHRKDAPVGTARFNKPTKAGITFEAEFPVIDTPGVVHDRVNEAWDSVKAGLIKGVSIGFRVINDAIEPLATGGLRFLKTEILELSLVSVPANADATLAMVKSIDAPYLAASGHHTPGVTGTLPQPRAEKGAYPMTIAEMIAGLENKRAASYAAAMEIQNKAVSEGRSKDESEREKYDTLIAEVKSCDSELVDLRDAEKMSIVKATPITQTTNQVEASALRGGTVTTPVITVKPNLPKGTAFTRYAMALAGAKGDSYSAIERAKSWADSTPEVEQMVRATLNWNVKAAVAAGTTTDATWAGPLAVVQPLVNEFLELLRPNTLIDSVEGFRKVPFNVSVPAQTGGGTYSWVGQNKPKPVTAAAFATVSVGFAKATGIIVLTEELVRLSTPSAEQTVRNEMIAGIKQFLDGQLTDPTVAAVANVNPAAITNGAPTAAASGATAAAARADIVARIQTFTAAELSLSESEIWMNESNAFALSNALNALGQPLFPGFTGQTGSLIMGLRARVTNVVGTRVILVHTPSILFADDGGVSVDASREASLQMDSAPTDPTDATTVMVSLWQRNLVGLKAERWISWTKARSAAVTYISAAAYTGA